MKGKKASAESLRLIENPNLQIILGVVVLGVMGGSLVGPILPAMKNPLKISESALGMILSVYTFCALVFTPVFGALADRVGRKPILIPTTIVYGTAGMLIAFTRDFYLVLGLRALQGMGVGGMMNLAVILIGDLFHHEARVKAMGYRSSAQSITTASVPFIGGGLATIAWFYPFFLYTAAIPLGVIAARGLKIGTSKTNQDPLAYFRSVFHALQNHRTVWIYLSNLFMFVLLYCIVVYFPIFLAERFSLSSFYAGLATSFFSTISAVIASQSGKLMNKYSEYGLLLIGFSLCGLSLFLLPFGLFYGMLLSFLLFFGLGSGLITPTLNTLATELAPKRLRAGVVSGFTTMTYIGQSISPPIFGLILQYSNLSYVFFSAGLLTLFPISLILFGYFQQEK